MKLHILVCTLFAGLFLSLSCNAQSDSASGEVIEKCGSFPVKPTIPSGRQSTEEEMIVAQTTMKAFLTEGNKYMECIDDLEEGWGKAATEKQKAVVVIFHNKIVDEQQAVADLFNAAVRAYKGKK